MQRWKLRNEEECKQYFKDEFFAKIESSFTTPKFSVRFLSDTEIGARMHVAEVKFEDEPVGIVRKFEGRKVDSVRIFLTPELQSAKPTNRPKIISGEFFMKGRRQNRLDVVNWKTFPSMESALLKLSRSDNV